ncbi:NUDIX domain-containing protein [Dactylosporangium sp. CA-092794]|uniref:NUDIX domain-containing protein n=1 Tax=Dactylosporangium sp. CA-092794 TaxID=3239929 RepID=UPI003D8B21C3
MTVLDMRAALRGVVTRLVPFDEREAADRSAVMAWIDSGADLYRRVPPDRPPQHLVTYFLPFDSATDQVFLVAHRKAGLWLPPGGHVEPGEAPWAAVEREADEELSVAARPHTLTPDRQPLFLTVTETVGPGQHHDATLWFLLALDREARMAPDPVEFTGYGWFRRTDVAAWPAGRSDPEMPRALAKLASRLHLREPGHGDR